MTEEPMTEEPVDLLAGVDTADPIAVAVVMTKVMGQLSMDLSAFKADSSADRLGLHKQATLDRKLIRAVILSIVFEVALIFGVGYFAQRAGTAARAASAATSAARVQADDARATCLSSNEARATNLQLWLFVLDSPGANSNPAQAAQVVMFRAHVKEVFAPRVC